MGKWDKFRNITAETINAEIEDLSRNDTEVPDDIYNVTIERMGVTESRKSKNPMLSVWFRITDGDQGNRLIFMNQIILAGDNKDGFRVSTVNAFLKSLNVFEESEITFKNMEDYDELIDDIANEVIGNQYKLDYSHNKSGYPVFKIIE